MDSYTAEERKIINDALAKFEKKLKLIEQDSSDAYALVIFINACFDTGVFQSNRYSALVHFQKARQAANEIQGLLSINNNYFNDAIKHAHQRVINKRIIHVDLCFG